MFKKWNKTQITFGIWLFLSAGMLITIFGFYINEYLDHPQHGHFDSMKEIHELIGKIDAEEGTHIYEWYVAYFIMDAFWALCTLVLIGLYCKVNFDVLWSRANRLSLYSGVFIVLAGLGYVFDLVEGVCYVFFLENFDFIVFIKVIAYGIVLIFPLYKLISTQIIPHFKSIRRFLRTSALSIFFIAIVYALIMFIPQGKTIVIHLFFQSYNLVILYFLLAFLSLIISHYAVYFDIWLYGDNRCVKLHIHNGTNLLGFGTIYYDTLTHQPGFRMYNDNRAKVLRRSLGIWLYVAVFDIFMNVWTSLCCGENGKVTYIYMWGPCDHE